MGIPEGLFAAGPEALPRALGVWDAWRRPGTPEGELACLPPGSGVRCYLVAPRPGAEEQREGERT